jgi:DNA-binding PadR family transcriptional regulator
MSLSVPTTAIVAAASQLKKQELLQRERQATKTAATYYRLTALGRQERQKLQG